MSVVGFDFGYQTCYIAVARQGGIETIANEYSDRCTPSVVSYGDQNRVVGLSAKNQMITNWKNTIWGWKTLLGRHYGDPVVQRERDLLPYDLCEGPNGAVGIRVTYLGHSELFSAEQVTATLFTKLKEVASVALKIKVVDCVISVPCYFTDVARSAMLCCAQIAGLNVLRLMNDVTAASLVYAFYNLDLPLTQESPRVVTLIDVGHCDTQVAVCAMNRGRLRVIATSFDPDLGGRSFDLAIADHLASEFKGRYGLDARSSQRSWLRLIQEAERVKKMLSQNSAPVPINIECFLNDRDVTSSISRAQMENLTRGLLERFDRVLRNACTNANLRSDEIHSVELIGGSSRIPVIKEIVRAVFGKEPSTTLNADEAVARGCALQCALMSPSLYVRDFAVIDCLHYPISLSWDDTTVNDNRICVRGQANAVCSRLDLFDRFCPVPISTDLNVYQTGPFVLHAVYSRSDQVPYLQAVIGDFAVDKVAPRPSGDNIRVTVKVGLNVHGMFEVAGASMYEKEEDERIAEQEVEELSRKQEMEEEKQGEDLTEPMTDESELRNTSDGKNVKKSSNTRRKSPRERKKTIDLPVINLGLAGSLPREQINAFRDRENQMISRDREESERADSKNSLEEYLLELRGGLDSHLESYAKDKERDKFRTLLEKTEGWLYDEGQHQTKKVYLEKLESLKKLGEPIRKRFSEACERPAAFEDLRRSLEYVEGCVQAHARKDELHSHIPGGEMERVRKVWKEKSSWYEQKAKAIAKQQPFDDPSVLAEQIRDERKSLEDLVGPILNRPKPKIEQENLKQEDSSSEGRTCGTESQDPRDQKEQVPNGGIDWD